MFFGMRLQLWFFTVEQLSGPFGRQDDEYLLSAFFIKRSMDG
jgi:hypothetical protein